MCNINGKPTRKNSPDPSNLHLAETVFPDGNVGSNTVLAVVHEDNPKHISEDLLICIVDNLHSVNIHGLASVEIVVLEVTDNLLGIRCSAFLESRDLLITGSLGLHGFLDLLHVFCSNY